MRGWGLQGQSLLREMEVQHNARGKHTVRATASPLAGPSESDFERLRYSKGLQRLAARCGFPLYQVSNNI